MALMAVDNVRRIKRWVLVTRTRSVASARYIAAGGALVKSALVRLCVCLCCALCRPVWRGAMRDQIPAVILIAHACGGLPHTQLSAAHGYPGVV